MLQKSPDNYKENYSIDVTTFVQRKLQDPDRCHGLCFSFYSRDNDWRMIKFCSSDHQDKELRPELIIDYYE
mgnify:CR=1 FL=1